jgi:hypothetical protein
MSHTLRNKPVFSNKPLFIRRMYARARPMDQLSAATGLLSMANQSESDCSKIAYPLDINLTSNTNSEEPT